uniref:Uncharacterized protein n=1 Tax=Arundo donax TaxID=35708 RepID=A0A0A9ACZ6_ARUDO
MCIQIIQNNKICQLHKTCLKIKAKRNFGICTEKPQNPYLLPCSRS